MLTGISNVGGIIAGTTTTSSGPALPVAGTPATLGIDRSFVLDGVRTYLDRFQGGEFDDPTIAARLVAMERQQAQSAAMHQALIGGHAVTTSSGANAVPDSGATVFDVTSGVIRDTAVLQTLVVQQAEARYANIDAALRADFPLADTLPSEAEGWNPETFVPTTPQEAQAFSQRIVADTTRAAARLEVLVATRDAAEVVARTTGDPAAKAKLAQLDGLVAQQLDRVDRLARLVDTSSGGTVTTAGAAALAFAQGASPDATALGALRDSARRRGSTDQTVERVVGAAALGRKRVSGTRGSERVLRDVAADVATFTWRHRDNLAQARAAEERRIEQRRADERAIERRERQRRDDEFAAMQQAQFEAWQQVQTFVLRREQRSAEDHQLLLQAIDERKGRTPMPLQRSVGEWVRDNAIEKAKAPLDA